MTAVTGILGTHFWHLLMVLGTWIVGYWFIKRHFRKATAACDETAGLLKDRQELREVELSIRGMTCASCAARVAKALDALEGVSALVNYATDRAVVRAPARYPVRSLIEEIEKTGYSAEEIRPDHGPDERVYDDARVRHLGRRLVVAAVLFMPLCDGSIVLSLVPADRFPYWQWVLVSLAAPVVVWAAWPIHAAAIRAARHCTFTMDTLVSIGIVASSGWSLYALSSQSEINRRQSLVSLFFHWSGGATYLDVAAGVTTFLLAGRFYEAFSKRRTGDVLRSLASVGAKDATMLDADGTEHRVPVGELRVGDRFVVRPGEKIACDGQVLHGAAGVDRSMISGESRPVEVGPGDEVVGGTIALTGRLVVTATQVGADTQLAQMIGLVERAQNEKAAVQRLADRIAAVFVPVVIAVAVCTLAGWLVAGGTAEKAISAALAVLIIACPCALGLATPTALYVASGRGAQLGIFVKGYQALESSRAIDTVVLDKTGTVTEGRMTVVGVEATPGVTNNDLLRYAGAVEAASEHSIAVAVAAAAREVVSDVPEVQHFSALPGRGAQGSVDGRHVVVGSARLIDELGMAVPWALQRAIDAWNERGCTTFVVAVDHEVGGAVALSDTVKPSSFEAVRQLHTLGLRCILLSGDNERTTRKVGATIGVDDVFSGALPAEKLELIRRLQGDGHSVAVVGDGVNDGPALVAADLGLAIGAGTDVAISAADMILLRDDLGAVADSIGLARRTLRTIHGNLLWAFAYNVSAIPLAAVGLLNPLVAGASMALSSAFVVWNSSRLRRFGRGGAGDARNESTVTKLHDEVPAAPRRHAEARSA